MDMDLDLGGARTELCFFFLSPLMLLLYFKAVFFIIITFFFSFLGGGMGELEWLAGLIQYGIKRIAVS